MVVLIRFRPVGRFFHRPDAAVHFFARSVRDIEQNFGRIRHPLNRSHHLIDGSRGFAHARGLRLRALHHVLHVDAHLVHGAGHFIDRRRSLKAVSCRLVRSAGHLRRSARHLRRRIAHIAHHAAQTLHHAGESICQSVVRGARSGPRPTRFPPAIGFRNRRHLFQVLDQRFESSSQLPNLILTLNIDGVFQIAGLADLVGHMNQPLQRIRNVHWPCG